MRDILTETGKIFSNELKTIRKLLKLTQKELAKLCGLKRHDIENWESLKCLPSFQNIFKISKIIPRIPQSIFSNYNTIYGNNQQKIPYILANVKTSLFCPARMMDISIKDCLKCNNYMGLLTDSERLILLCNELKGLLNNRHERRCN